jgi:hypothetical protein
MQRDEILAEVRRTALENGGKPLGKARFEALTGITSHDWLRYWVRFGDMQKDAGFESNKLQGAYEQDYLARKLVELTREIGTFPTHNERRRKAMNDSSFPASSTFGRLGDKNMIVKAVRAYCANHPNYEDVDTIFAAAIVESNTVDDAVEDVRYGFVYLVRGHPGEYKIGRTNLVDRRLSELGATASIEQTLIHEIKTDDPAGIESYWHTRFTEKRMRGEWFRLNAADVKAFKRWRKIY